MLSLSNSFKSIADASVGALRRTRSRLSLKYGKSLDYYVDYTNNREEREIQRQERVEKAKADPGMEPPPFKVGDVVHVIYRKPKHKGSKEVRVTMKRAKIRLEDFRTAHQKGDEDEKYRWVLPYQVPEENTPWIELGGPQWIYKAGYEFDDADETENSEDGGYENDPDKLTYWCRVLGEGGLLKLENNRQFIVKEGTYQGDVNCEETLYTLDCFRGQIPQLRSMGGGEYTDQ